MSHTRSIVSGLILAGAVMTSSMLGNSIAANAAPSPDDVSIYVGDLDLRSEAGARTALRRISLAASQACGGAPHPLDLTRSQAYRGCVQDITGRAVKSLGSPLVTALHKKQAKEDRLALRGSRTDG